MTIRLHYFITLCNITSLYITTTHSVLYNIERDSENQLWKISLELQTILLSKDIPQAQELLQEGKVLSVFLWLLLSIRGLSYLELLYRL